MQDINWMTVIVSITAYITITINLKNLSKKLICFRTDMIEACTTEVAKYVKSVIK